MGYTRDQVSAYLSRIKSAILGRDVRDSIHDSIAKIADEVDRQVSSLSAIQASATEIVTGYQLNQQAIDKANTDMNTLRSNISGISSAFENLANAEVNLVGYTENGSTGVWDPTEDVSVDFDPDLDTPVADRSPKFTFTFIRPPVFKQAVNVSVNNTANSASGSYNPNTGDFTIILPNLVRQEFANATFEVTNVTPNENNEYSDTPGASYDPDTGTFSFKLLQGKNGTGAMESIAAMAKRPFFIRDLYVSDPSIFLQNAAAPNYFPLQSRVDRERIVDQESGKIIFNGANDFDAAIIVFRKTVDNNSGVQLNNNFSWNKTKAADITKQKNAAFLASNIDYKSTVSVFIRKPAYNPSDSSSERMTSATACFIDAAGRQFTRRVHWTAVDCHLVCQGGAKKTWPSISIVPDVDNNADANGVGTYGTQVGDVFTGAFIFENAKNGANGDTPEWSWHALNTYRQTTLSGSDKNPQVQINYNKIINQVLIPERIIGISFGASQELVELYTGPRYTDSE